MYQIHGLHKYTELDNFEGGCDPDTGRADFIEVHFTGKTANDVISKAADFLGIDEDGIERNACEEPGRVDFATTEGEDGNPLSPSEYKQFKQGKIKAWYAVYTAYVEQVTPAEL